MEQAGSSPFPPPPQPPLELLEHLSPVLQSQSTSKTQPSSPLSRSELQKWDSKVVDPTLKLNKYSNDHSHLKSRSLSTPRLPTNFPILNLLPELILSVAGHLDYSTAILLSVSCKKTLLYHSNPTTNPRFAPKTNRAPNIPFHSNVRWRLQPTISMRAYGHLPNPQPKKKVQLLH